MLKQRGEKLIKRPINYIFLEGPDLAGKTTFYEDLHKETGYRWNVQDRSALSMLIHAKYYERNTFQHVEQLRAELANLNNIMIILLPEWDEIGRRFNLRGDPIQNITSLRKLYDLFSEAATELEAYPNVIVLRNRVDNQTVKYLASRLRRYENASTEDLQTNFLNSVAANENNEFLGLNVTLFDDGSFEDIDEGYLLYDKEVDYYNEIITTLTKKISDEVQGKNEYNRIEDKYSRRFIYSSDTCISLAHFLLRGEGLDCKFFLRSSNVKDTLFYDLNFLKYLSSQVYNILGANGLFCRMNITINSGHILEDKE